MSSDRFHLIAAVYIILLKDDKVFLTKRQNTGWSDGMWSLVGGHMDGNEKATQAAIREAKEETGIEVSEKDLEFINVSHLLTNSERVHFTFLAKKWKGTPHNNEPEKASETAWFDLKKLPKNLTENSKHTIECFLKNTLYSEFGL